MSVFTLEELQKMDKNELITIIGNYISDQEIWLNQAKELEKQNDKKNAEIERLTEDWKQRINKARQRQFNNLKKEELASAYEKLVESLEDELERRQIDYTEHQKQVDELTEERDVFKRLFESANTSHFSTDSIIETMNSFYREQAEHLAGLKIEQATKDAVKKFADLVEFHSVATIENNVEYFTISALGLKEILRENFDIEVE